METATANSAKQFIESLGSFMKTFVTEAEERDKGKTRSIEDYFPIRRVAIAAVASSLGGDLHLNIPDEAFYHPTIKEMQDHTADMMLIYNVRIVMFLRPTDLCPQGHHVI
jgi:hypothetical protein